MHCATSVAPGGDVVPGGHSVHVGLPLVLEKVPAVHTVHVSSTGSAKVPGLQ
jgi:hypothetical protein